MSQQTKAHVAVYVLASLAILGLCMAVYVLIPAYPQGGDHQNTAIAEVVVEAVREANRADQRSRQAQDSLAMEALMDARGVTSETRAAVLRALSTLERTQAARPTTAPRHDPKPPSTSLPADDLSRRVGRVYRARTGGSGAGN